MNMRNIMITYIYQLSNAVYTQKYIYGVTLIMNHFDTQYFWSSLSDNLKKYYFSLLYDKQKYVVESLRGNIRKLTKEFYCKKIIDANILRSGRKQRYVTKILNQIFNIYMNVINSNYGNVNRSRNALCYGKIQPL